MKTTHKTLFFSLIFSISFTANASRSLASIRQSLRVEHARELMGNSYKKSVVSKHENRSDLEKKIHEIVKTHLPKIYKRKSHEISKTIIDESSKHSLDPYFVMAVISGESSFNPVAIGPVGEVGLMQIRASTGKWMANIIKSKWQGEKTLKDPVMNIKLGTAYLAWLRNKFSGHGQLYLAAYNMGPTSVRNAVSRNVYPKDYPIHVMKRYIAFYKEIGKKKTAL